VEEFCLDWRYDTSSLGSEAVTNPVGETVRYARALCGGGWYQPAKKCRSASWSNNYPFEPYPFHGLRLACRSPLMAITVAETSGGSALDTRTGTRISRGAESITYSTEWNSGSSCTVKAEGSVLKSAAAPEEGTVPWFPDPGYYTLTHEAGNETLAAEFIVLASVTARDDVTYWYTVRDGGALLWDVEQGTVSGSAIIPAKMGGRAVTAIGPNAFTNCAALADVSIPSSVTNIEGGAFCGCEELSAVYFFGDAPTVLPDSPALYDGSTNVVTYVGPESTGWDGTEGSPALPAVWQGRPIVRLTRKQYSQVVASRTSYCLMVLY
jgi:hypothetical protein